MAARVQTESSVLAKMVRSLESVYADVLKDMALTEQQLVDEREALAEVLDRDVLRISGEETVEIIRKYNMENEGAEEREEAARRLERRGSSVDSDLEEIVQPWEIPRQGGVPMSPKTAFLIAREDM